MNALSEHRAFAVTSVVISVVIGLLLQQLVQACASYVFATEIFIWWIPVCAGVAALSISSCFKKLSIVSCFLIGFISPIVTVALGFGGMELGEACCDLTSKRESPLNAQSGIYVFTAMFPMLCATVSEWKRILVGMDSYVEENETSH